MHAAHAVAPSDEAKVPTEQGSHRSLLCEDEAKNVPGGQGEHTLFAVEFPRKEAKVPAEQRVRLAHTASVPGRVVEPLAISDATAGASSYWSAEHRVRGAQTLSWVAFPSHRTYSVKGSQTVRSLQTLSEVGVLGVATYCFSASQRVTGMQTLSMTSVSLPLARRYSPAAQVVYGAHTCSRRMYPSASASRRCLTKVFDGQASQVQHAQSLTPVLYLRMYCCLVPGHKRLPPVTQTGSGATKLLTLVHGFRALHTLLVVADPGLNSYCWPRTHCTLGTHTGVARVMSL